MKILQHSLPVPVQSLQISIGKRAGGRVEEQEEAHAPEGAVGVVDGVLGRPARAPEALQVMVLDDVARNVLVDLFR